MKPRAAWALAGSIYILVACGACALAYVQGQRDETLSLASMRNR